MEATKFKNPPVKELDHDEDTFLYKIFINKITIIVSAHNAVDALVVMSDELDVDEFIEFPEDFISVYFVDINEANYTVFRKEDTSGESYRLSEEFNDDNHRRVVAVSE